jgi:hypothetical protein
MRSRPVKPRATRMALMVASVPDDTKRTCSSPGYAATRCSASSISGSHGAPNDVPRDTASTMACCTSGWACPRISGPHEHTRSM